ncbi:MAG TPA: DNA ligase, partial [Ornithinimicrobium sp.]|nr:DNA ligase [Ornithinimicrobium sp.]
MRPMLATSGEATGPQDLPHGPQWAHEIKWDGVRLLADVRKGQVVLRTRSGRDVSAGFPELARLADLAEDVLLDGEAVAFVNGEPSFTHVVHRVHAGTGRRARADPQTGVRTHPVTFVAFDLLRLDGLEVTGLPWTDRRAALEDLWFPAGSRTLSPVHEDAASLWS